MGDTPTTTFIPGMPLHTQQEDSKVPMNCFKFLFNNPLLLQNLLSWEKLIPSDQLEIDWALHPDRPVVQTVSLIRLQRSYLASRFNVRITRESRVLAIPSNLVSSYNSSNSTDLNDLSDSDAIPQVVDDFLSLSEDRCYMLLLHHSESSWEMIGCLSPTPLIKVEVIDLSSDDEEAVSPPLHQPTSSTTMHPPVWTNPDMQNVRNVVDPLDITDYGAHHTAGTVAPPRELSIFEFEMLKMTASMVITRNEPPFQCSICNITTWSKKALMRHLNVHDPRKDLKCPVSSCSFVTNKKCHLDRHVLSFHLALHDEKIVRSCPTCTKFDVLSTYKRHVRNCSGTRFFICSVCNFMAKRYSDLFKHQRLEHSLPFLRGLLVSDISRSITPPIGSPSK